MNVPKGHISLARSANITPKAYHAPSGAYHSFAARGDEKNCRAAVFYFSYRSGVFTPGLNGVRR